MPAGYHGSMTDYAALKAAGAPVLGWGQFVTVLINFIILAFIIFLLIKMANRMMEEGGGARRTAAEPAEVALLREIRDELRKQGQEGPGTATADIMGLKIVVAAVAEHGVGTLAGDHEVIAFTGEDSLSLAPPLMKS